MVTLSKLYTGSGDRGKTHLVGGTVTDKFSPRVSAYGDIDELNAYCGLIRTACSGKHEKLSEWIGHVQNELFDIGSIVASPANSTHESLPEVTDAHVKRLEHWIDTLVAPLPVLRSFVIPGGSELNARFHIARTVCRRAERTLCELAAKESVPEPILIYMNRLSDLLFAAARYSSHVEGQDEYMWIPGKKITSG